MQRQCATYHTIRCRVFTEIIHTKFQKSEGKYVDQIWILFRLHAQSSIRVKDVMCGGRQKEICI